VATAWHGKEYLRRRRICPWHDLWHDNFQAGAFSSPVSSADPSPMQLQKGLTYSPTPELDTSLWRPYYRVGYSRTGNYLSTGKEPVMAVFVGRAKELATLRKAFESKRSELVPVYGRRRVGKSELLTHFMHGRPGIYFLGKKSPVRMQLREFMCCAAAALGKAWLAEIDPGDWMTALRRVVSEWDEPKGKLVIALDEFQWTCESSPDLPAVLQELWDREWKGNGKILLILCGSYIGFMEREVLGRKSPLYGRRTAQIQLKPFPFFEAAQFHASWSEENRAIAWFLCGGVPYYLELVDSHMSIENNIVANFLNEHSALFGEPDFLLREELRQLPVYNGILTALGTGCRRPSEIAAWTGVAETSLGYYLQQLCGLGYVKKRYPLSPRKPSPRSVSYELDDPLLRFWFRFVGPNISAITFLGPRTAYLSAVKPRLDSYFGHCFERMCRDALPYIYKREGVVSAFEIGEYWADDLQIDVVGIRQDRWIDLGECKWTGRNAVSSAAKEIVPKCERFPNPRNCTIHPRVFVRRGKPDAVGAGKVRVHRLPELYELA